uniref:Uncharacterized protein n=1 Tax=Romanomermis culicivorax TaxID=13658 RepID=A0A915I330_ROMCU
MEIKDLDDQWCKHLHRMLASNKPFTSNFVFNLHKLLVVWGTGLLRDLRGLAKELAPTDNQKSRQIRAKCGINTKEFNFLAIIRFFK